MNQWRAEQRKDSLRGKDRTEQLLRSRLLHARSCGGSGTITHLVSALLSTQTETIPRGRTVALRSASRGIEGKWPTHPPGASLT